MKYINQSRLGLLSRKDANPYFYEDENGNKFLPLITAPMTSVVNEQTLNSFMKSGIQVCLPRTDGSEFGISSSYFYSCSLDSFEEFIIGGLYDSFIKESEKSLKICIDTANGNNPRLHEMIIKAKEMYGDKLIIMSGNVSSVEAFIELAKTGCDYIRVGIGGGAGCNTSKNTFVGQTNLGYLIQECYNAKSRDYWVPEYDSSFLKKQRNLLNVKIVADGISSYIDLTLKEGMAYDNGYGAIINLLYSGADLIMIGKLFAQSLESAGRKFIKHLNSKGHNIKANPYIDLRLAKDKVVVEYYGMSTKRAQEIYGQDASKHSEGKTVYLDVRWSLDEWLNGSKEESDFLPGFVNCLKSAMSYTGSNKLSEFNFNHK